MQYIYCDFSSEERPIRCRKRRAPPKPTPRRWPDMRASCALSPIFESIRSGIEQFAAETAASFVGPCKLTLARAPSQVPSFSVHSAFETKEPDFSLRAT